MQWYESEVQAMERAVVSCVKASRPPTFYGSSSIRLWNTLAEDVDPSVANLGFGGSTLEACAHFYPRLVKPLGPRSLLVYAGDNDLGDGRAADEVLDFFRSLASQVAASCGAIPFGFVSIKPSPARYSLIDPIRRFNALVQREIETIPGAYYVDVYSYMLDGFGKPRAEFFLEDGLHLNREGYRLWTRILRRYRNKILTM
jgi:lysophospholipase L1-like esterase